MKLRRSGSRDEPCQRASCSPVVSAALGSAPRPGVFTDGGGGAERLGACRDTSAGTEHGAACRSLSLQHRGSLHRELAWWSSVCNVLVGPQRVVGLGGRCPREGAAGTEVCGGDAAWRARSASSAWPTEAGVWPGQWVGGGCGRNGEGAEGASSQGTLAKDRSQPPEAASGGWEDPGAGAVGTGADAPCAPADAPSSPPPPEAEAGASPDSFQPGAVASGAAPLACLCAVSVRTRGAWGRRRCRHERSPRQQCRLPASLPLGRALPSGSCWRRVCSLWCRRRRGLPGQRGDACKGPGSWRPSAAAHPGARAPRDSGSWLSAGSTRSRAPTASPERCRRRDGRGLPGRPGGPAWRRSPEERGALPSTWRRSFSKPGCPQRLPKPSCAGAPGALGRGVRGGPQPGTPVCPPAQAQGTPRAGRCPTSPRWLTGG